MPKRLGIFLALCVLLLASIMLRPWPVVGEDSFPDICDDDPNNLTRNCKFNDGRDHWHSFVQGGTPPDFGTIDGPDCHSPDCPSLYIEAEEWFVGGVYQRVSNVIPGARYWANVIWLTYHPAGALDDTVGRRIGIDPTGGTNPNSPNVIWGKDVWKKFDDCTHKICRGLQVEVEAKNTEITVFVRIEDTWKNRPEEFPEIPAPLFETEEKFWIDDIGLIMVPGSEPTATPTPTPFYTPTPTATPKPVSTVISVAEGGSLVSSGDHSTSITFPPNAVRDTTVVTYAHRSVTDTGSLEATQYVFDLSASQNGTPIRRFRRPLTVAVRYAAPHIVGVDPDSLALYWMATDTTWLSLTTAATGDHIITGSTDHFTLFALLGEAGPRLFFPLIWR